MYAYNELLNSIQGINY